ncbi:hypothetical protein [Streptantibioticus silvisoli]|uniref:Uncharacterized protein n=1 Tax=Streptantibioticus silvisoli TaxID=2705255 RepID=A0ABT6VSY4_9ACTN|nr:hypothetical protein [Streptantibioticus silvisoli]MDI5961590.1 hypothetical protein [Streptantibioticus silvisoli]
MNERSSDTRHERMASVPQKQWGTAIGTGHPEETACDLHGRTGPHHPQRGPARP